MASNLKQRIFCLSCVLHHLPSSSNYGPSLVWSINIRHRFHTGHMFSSHLREYALARKNFQWTKEQDMTFKRIKRTMAGKILVHFPDFSKVFHVFTDASDYQLGGVLVQDDFPIAFYSRKLNEAQKIIRKWKRTSLNC